MASYLPIPQTEEPTVELQQHQGNHHRMQRRGGFCFRLTRVGSRIAVTLAFISLFSLAYFHLRSPHEISLSAFQVVPIRACKSWFEGADVSVASSSSNFVSVHRIDLNQFQVKTRDYSLGYNVTLYSDDYSPRSHIREFHFDAIAPFSVSFESTSPVLFFVKTEYHRHRDHRHKSHSDKHHDRKHPRSETTSSVQPEEFEASFKHGPSGNFSHVPHLEAALTGVRQVKPTLGKYTFVISLPKNTVDSQIDIKVKFDAKIATLSFDDCPYASSLREGRSHVRFNKHESKTIKHVIAVSPHTAAGTVAFVKLIPRTHKFVLVSASLLAVAIFLRLINKFLRCKAKRACQRANGERRPCFFSRIFKRQPVQQAQPAFVHVVVPSPSAPVYTPQL